MRDKPGLEAARRKVVLAVPSSDCHVVGNRLLEWLLSSEGYEVKNLGVCTPSHEIAAEIANCEPIAAVIGGYNGHALADLADLRELMAVYGVPPDLPVYIGGNLTVGVDKSQVTVQFAQIGLTVLDTFEELLHRLSSLPKPAIKAYTEAPVRNL